MTSSSIDLQTRVTRVQVNGPTWNKLTVEMRSFSKVTAITKFFLSNRFKKWRWNQTSCLKMTQIDFLWVKTKIIFSEEVNDPPIHIEGVKCQDPVFFYFCKNRCDNTTSSVKPNARVVWFDCKDELEKGYLPSNMLSLETCDDS